MTTHILIIAHAPLAHALRECALHVFPECTDEVQALDVPPNEPPEQTQAAAQAMLDQHPGPVLLLTDVFGATPCNVAQRLAALQALGIHLGQAGDHRLLGQFRKSRSLARYKNKAASA